MTAAPGVCRVGRGLSLLALLVLASGCATPAMKGTPFYTGEYEKRMGDASERVNLWPLLYYREPALSVLWPIGEKTDDHLAVRPLFSVYGLSRENRVVNVLWPLARYDAGEREGHVFPFFWGPEYRVGFPLYWRRGDPGAGTRGRDALFPLWSVRTDATGGASVHLAWPVFHWKRTAGHAGWRVWPLAGHYARGEREHTFYAWPFGHAWKDPASDIAGHLLFPLYARAQMGADRVFLSLPYSQGDDGVRRFVTVLPLFHWRRDPEGARFRSILYCQDTRVDRSAGMRLAFPLYYMRFNPGERWVVTPLGGNRRRGEASLWFAPPLLSGGTRNGADHRDWYAAGLAYDARAGESRTRYVAPVYFRRTGPAGETLVTPLWSRGETSAGRSWWLAPPFAYAARTPESRLLVTPLYARERRQDGRGNWDSVIPLYLNIRRPDGRLVATPLGGWETSGDDVRWLAPWLLSGGRTGVGEGSFWGAAPLVHAAWGPEGRRSHVLPFYYRDSATDTWITPLAARWTAGDARVTLVPPAVSWRVRRADRDDLWLAGPLVHRRTEPDRSSGHVFPLVSWDTRTGRMLTPLYGRWTEEGRRTTVLPLLLSGWRRDTRGVAGLAGLGLAGWARRDGQWEAAHLFPLAAWRRGDYVYTPLVGRKTGAEGYTYPLTPLAGVRHGDRKGGWVFPLWSHRRERNGALHARVLWGGYWSRGADAGSGLFPLFRYRSHGAGVADTGETAAAAPPAQVNRWKRLWVFPVCWYRSSERCWTEPRGLQTANRTRSEVRHGVFPLWSYRRTTHDEPLRDARAVSVLLRLYDSEVFPARGQGAGEPLVRRRVLWRLWHYERSGEAVSVDVFPGITWDREEDGDRVFSVWWRLLRFEKRATGGTRGHALFIPFGRDSTHSHPSATGPAS